MANSLKISTNERVIERLSFISALNKENIVCIGRSFWDEEAYGQIMKGREKIPIGINLIDLKVELFKEINWTGSCTFNIDDKIW